MDLDQNADNPLDEDVFFKDYKPIQKDLITVPKHVVYLLLAVGVTAVTLFAIIRHLIKDLIHDLADFLFGEQPVEEEHESALDRREKLRSKWIPETSLELEDIVKEDEIQPFMLGREDLPSIWTISDGLKSYASPAIQKTDSVNKPQISLNKCKT